MVGSPRPGTPGPQIPLHLSSVVTSRAAKAVPGRHIGQPPPTPVGIGHGGLLTALGTEILAAM